MTAARAAPASGRRQGAGQRAQALRPRASRAAGTPEQQARLRARQFVRGEGGLGDGLARVATAAYVQPASPGEALPWRLCQSLEEAFDADLRAVRIHRDAAAQAAAHAHGAQAFASGADIYFAAGAYRPAQEAGLDLIAHEVTHVLQQTARVDAASRLTAQALAGSGCVQKSVRDLPRAFSGTQSIDALANVHAAAAPDAATQQAIHSLQATLHTTLDSDDLWPDHPYRERLLARVDSGEWTNAEAPVRALLADALRALGATAQLSALLVADPTLKCVLHRDEVWSETIPLMGKAWLAEQLARAPLPQWYPEAFVRTFRTYLFAPRRAVQALEASDPTLGNYADWSRRFFGNTAYTTLAENELFHLAVDLLRIANEERITLLSGYEREARRVRGNVAPYLIRRDVAHRLAAAWEQLATAPASANATDSASIFLPVLPRLRQDAGRADALWTAVQGAFIEHHAAEQLRAQADSPLAQGLHTALLNFAETAFARTADGRLPSPRVYGAQLAHARHALRRFVTNDVEAGLIRMAGRSDYDAGTATWSGLVLAFVPELTQKVDDYDQAADQRNEREQAGDVSPLAVQRQWGADLRIEHRLLLARVLLGLAGTLEWTDVVERCRQVSTASDTGEAPGRTELALLTPWQADTRAQIADFASTDSGLGFEPDVPILGLGFVTPRTLANVYYTEYATRVADALEDILQGGPGRAGEEGDYGSPRPSIRSRVQPVMDAAPRPRRYFIEAGRWLAAVHPDDPVALYDLVKVHPRTVAFMRVQGVVMELQDAVAAPLAVFPRLAPDPAGALYFWSIPPLEPLVTRLRAITALDLAVRTAMAVAAAPMTSAEGESTPAITPEPVPEPTSSTPTEGPFWWLWLQTFVTMAPADIAGFQQEAETAIIAESNIAAVRLTGLWRRAYAQDRQMLVLHQALPLLQAYAHIGVETYNHPTQALDLMVDFARNVLPENDELAHLNLALLEAFRPPASGDDPVEEFVQIRRYDLIVTWQRLLRQAIRAAAMPQRVLLLAVMTPGERADPAWLDLSSARIQRVVDAMEAAKAAAQLTTGMMVRPQGSEDAAHPAFIALPGSRELGGAESFTINGVVYQLVSAAHLVEFHPDFGNPAEIDSYTPSLLSVDGVPVAADPATGQRTGSRELFRIRRNGRQIIVRESDDALLEELSNAVGLRSVAVSLAELETFIEWTGNLIMDAAEFIPGAGQVLMATRLAVAVLSFIASPEFDEIRQQVLENPTGFIDGLISLIGGELFESDRLMGWILLGGLVPSSFDTVRNPRPGATPTRAPSAGSALARFAAVMRRLVQVGTRFGRSVNRVRQRMGQTFLSLESFVQGHPMLALGFEMIGDFAELLDPGVVRQARDILSGAGVVMQQIQDAFLNFPAHLGELIHTLNSLEIPREIIPMDQVLEILVTLVIERLGAKYRVAGRAILFVLDQLGLKQQLFQAIVEQLPKKGNPNHYWATMFVDQTLQPRFDAVRDDLIAGLNSLLDRFGFPQVPKDTASDAAVRPHGSEFPEVEAWPAAAPLPSAAAPPRSVAVPRGGQPLAVPLRRRLEGEFGHDLGHVRLHTGAESAAVSHAFSADGLSTGSHVYLAPHLSAERGHGQTVMRHEVAHVLQHSGARPLLADTRYPSTPYLPAARGGLRLDASAERAADAMAATAAQGRGRPLPVRGARTGERDSWRPALAAGTVGRIVRRLGRGQALLEHYRRMDPAHGGTVPAVETLPSSVAPLVANLHTELRDHVRHISGWPSGYSDELKTKITNYYFGVTSVEHLRNVVNRVARESLVQHRPAAAGGGAAADPPELRLNVRVFERGLEAYFLEEGLGMRLSFHTESREGWTYLRASERVRSIAFAFLNLAQVGSGSDLWVELMTNTWGTATTRGSDAWNRLQPRARTYLMARGTTVGVYGSPGLRLSHTAQAEIDAIANPATTIDLAHLPAPGDYVNASGKGAHNQGSGFVSLITGQYKDPAQTGHDRGKERESHHTTQFLLIEYFSNWLTPGPKPFKHSLALFEAVGLRRDGMQPRSFEPASGPAIGIKDLAGSSQSARGPEMPVISVTAETHQRGRLHIQARKPGPGDTGSATQSMAVHLEFRACLGDDAAANEIRTALFGSEDDFTRYTASDGHKTLMRERIHTAMQRTYRWMRDDMANRLQNGLESVEVAYYNNLAAQAGHSARLSAAEMAPAITAAANKNRQLMETTNHWS